jgi:hypothetical protein
MKIPKQIKEKASKFKDIIEGIRDILRDIDCIDTVHNDEPTRYIQNIINFKWKGETVSVFVRYQGHETEVTVFKHQNKNKELYTDSRTLYSDTYYNHELKAELLFSEDGRYIGKNHEVDLVFRDGPWFVKCNSIATKLKDKITLEQKTLTRNARRRALRGEKAQLSATAF